MHTSHQSRSARLETGDVKLSVVADVEVIFVAVGALYRTASGQPIQGGLHAFTERVRPRDARKARFVDCKLRRSSPGLVGSRLYGGKRCHDDCRAASAPHAAAWVHIPPWKNRTCWRGDLSRAATSHLSHEFYLHLTALHLWAREGNLSGRPLREALARACRAPDVLASFDGIDPDPCHVGAIIQRVDGVHDLALKIGPPGQFLH
mmetsp:Transcript_43829/g.115784  ORF Transcript_43829/g.115784 Transcript_43829/m.115784 type:complete len:205 (+) Transcript_43829:87-701(+)